jgi:hypothetical protein
MNPEQKHHPRSNRRHGNPGNLAALKRRLWRAFCDTEDLLDMEDLSPELRLRAIATMGTVGAVYAKLLEASELEARLSHMEALMEGRREASNGHAPAAIQA